MTQQWLDQPDGPGWWWRMPLSGYQEGPLPVLVFYPEEAWQMYNSHDFQPGRMAYVHMNWGASPIDEPQFPAVWQRVLPWQGQLPDVPFRGRVQPDVGQEGNA